MATSGCLIPACCDAVPGDIQERTDGLRQKEECFCFKVFLINFRFYFKLSSVYLFHRCN